ncbi:two-component response regulator [Fulvimarina pelagi HTCC2506]|uniref:Two-component response regulator n=1 Tax=Fulvimarina pelagi HTCC2506 TaxID=314231 RepID=Q0G780_9HYPH|nr:NepR family anti-sigma factor [Fulvimarina pelagi]EAU42484.1 two-component response regulator [Fulvimarina pelagi HTCC2506]
MDTRKAEKDGPGANEASEKKRDSEMSFALPSAIGDRLKAYYNDVASEPVPDRFLSLLEQLDQAEGEKKRKSDKEEVE